MAKKKPKRKVVKRKVVKAKVNRVKTMPVDDYIEEKCRNSEQAEAALVYAVRSFNSYFEDGVIIVRVGDRKHKVITFGPGSPKSHFKPVLWFAIKAAFEAFKEGPADDNIFEG